MTLRLENKLSTPLFGYSFDRTALFLSLLKSNLFITSSTHALLSHCVISHQATNPLPPPHFLISPSVPIRTHLGEMVRHIEIESSLSEDENIVTTVQAAAESGGGVKEVVEAPVKPGKEVDGEDLMQKVIAKANAGSEDENGADDDLDFGEEEEDDVTEPPPPDEVEPPTSISKKAADSSAVQSVGQDVPADVIGPSDDEAVSDDVVVEPSHIGTTKPSGRKRGRAKASDASPTKTARKSNSDAPGKGTRIKAVATKKKVTTVPPIASERMKGKAVKTAKSASVNVVKPSGSEKASSKPKVKPTKVAKPSTKGEDSENSDVKPKKTITKSSPSKVGGRKLVKTPVKTYSKKEAGGTTKRSTPTKKATSTKAASSVKKSSTPSKTQDKKKTTPRKRKVAKQESEEDEEEDNVDVAVDADEESEEESQPTQGDEATAAGKGSKLGNIACSTRDSNAQSLLDHAVQQLGQYRIVDYSGDCDTVLSAYVVGKGTKRGWGLLRAMVAGVPLVSDDWLSTSISNGKWADMKSFYTDRFGQSPRPVSGAGSLTHILDGMRVKVSCDPKEAANVRKLVTVCGGRVAETRVDIIINDSKKVIDGATNVEKKWLADSIEAGVAIEFEPYVVGKAPA